MSPIELDCGLFVLKCLSNQVPDCRDAFLLDRAYGVRHVVEGELCCSLHRRRLATHPADDAFVRCATSHFATQSEITSHEHECDNFTHFVPIRNPPREHMIPRPSVFIILQILNLMRPPTTWIALCFCTKTTIAIYPVPCHRSAVDDNATAVFLLSGLREVRPVQARVMS